MRKRALLAMLISAGLQGQAWASTPQAIYADPRRVDMLPDEAQATRVIIYGTFTKRQANGMYGEPACGYMYFACRAGQEAMCRMQWREIAGFVGSRETCAGFGQIDAVSDARVHAMGTPLPAPDPWDLGMGIAPGIVVGNRCPAAKQLLCTVEPAPMPTGDMNAGAPADMAKAPPPVPSGGCSLGGAAGAGAGLPALLLGLGLLRRRRRR